MTARGRKIALATIGSAIALSFVVFAVLFVRYERGGDPNNEDAILALARQAEALDDPPTAAHYWRRLVALNPFNKEYVRRHYHALVRMRDFEALSSYTNDLPVDVEFTENEKAIERLIAQGAEFLSAKSNTFAVTCFEEAARLNYYAGTPYLIDSQIRNGDIVPALDAAREYIKRFPNPTIVLHTVEWLALANRPDLIEETRQMLLAADSSYAGLVLDCHCDALIAWVKGDKEALAAALAKIGFDDIRTPVARMMALESAADGNDPKRVAEAYHALAAEPRIFDFPERGKRAIKRFVANHFPDKLPIHELGRIADLVVASGDEDLELLRVSLLARLIDRTLHDYMISHAEHLYPDDEGIKAIRQEYERAQSQE